MESRWIGCNACGADQFAPISTVDGWTIGRCRACGLVFVNPTAFFGATDEFSEMSRAFEYTEYMHQRISPEILAFERQQLLANAQEVARIEPDGAEPRVDDAVPGHRLRLRGRRRVGGRTSGGMRSGSTSTLSSWRKGATS